MLQSIICHLILILYSIIYIVRYAHTRYIGILATGLARYGSTNKAMPGIPLFVLGLISSAYNAKKAYDWK